MKKYFFFTGMPRGGQTLLGVLLNQNKKICLTPESIVLEILHYLLLLKTNSPLYINFKNQKSFDNVVANIFDNYYSNFKAEYIIDRGPWGTPGNRLMLDFLFEQPKFVVLYRPVLECLASFIKIEKPESIEKRCDMLMRQNGAIGKSLWSIKNIIANEKHILIKYDDLVQDPVKEIKKIYSFLGIEFTSIDTTNLKQFSINEIEYNDVLIEGIPHQGLHTIRTNEIKKRSYTIEEYLPNEVIKKYKNCDIIKQ